MNRLADYLQEAKTFYLATIEDHKPNVRPIGGKPALNEPGFVVADEKIYFYTDNSKPMYRQMKKTQYCDDIFGFFWICAGNRQGRI